MTMMMDGLDDSNDFAPFFYTFFPLLERRFGIGIWHGMDGFGSGFVLNGETRAYFVFPSFPSRDVELRQLYSLSNFLVKTSMIFKSLKFQKVCMF